MSNTDCVICKNVADATGSLTVDSCYFNMAGPSPRPAYLDARQKGRLPVNTTGWLEDFQDSWDWVHPYMSCAGDFSGQRVDATEKALHAQIRDAQVLKECFICKLFMKHRFTILNRSDVK